MADRNSILKFLNDYLEISSTNDRAMNGLQIEGKKEVKKIIVGVSASKELFKKAIEQKADMIIVHHGLFWGDCLPLKGFLRERINLLLSNNINLLAYHLPLDKHPIVGNNAQLINLFNISVIKPFGKYKGNFIGFKANFKKTEEISKILKTLHNNLFTEPLCLTFGKKKIKNLCVISGAAPEMMYQAIDEGLDLFLTGEPTEYVQEVARENSLNFISIGHYNSERLGVIALAKLISTKFDVKTTFIEIPNPI
ncbi:MAG: Nif3-like dinuclear metal center hexameric protein [bacterium]